MLKNINVSDLKRRLYEINIIDIRSIEKYNFSHIASSINIPSEILMANPNKYFDKTKEYYIYCQHGKTSLKVCMSLNKLGYKVVNIIGGYEAWILN